MDPWEKKIRVLGVRLACTKQSGINSRYDNNVDLAKAWVEYLLKPANTFPVPGYPRETREEGLERFMNVLKHQEEVAYGKDDSSEG